MNLFFRIASIVILLSRFSVAQDSRNVVIPLIDGRVIIKNLRFDPGTPPNPNNPLATALGRPAIVATLVNETTSTKWSITLHYELEVVCSGRLLKWSGFRSIPIRDERFAVDEAFRGCASKKLAVRLIEARNDLWRIDKDGNKTDLIAERKQREEEEAALHRLACRDVYAATSKKKAGDLTIRETEQMTNCQLLGLYGPQDQ
jgi:hypothetical protein